MILSIPNKDEIVQSIGDLFGSALFNYPEKILSALIVIDKELIKGNKIINEVVHQETDELCRFVNNFSDYINQTQDKSQRARLEVLLYCHIMEADLPMTVIWNLLHILTNEPIEWTFKALIPWKKKTVVCEHPSEKIEDIKRLSNLSRQRIGNILERLWCPNLRNAFSHSQYIIGGNYFMPSGWLSPLSRKRKEDITPYTFDEIDLLYSGVRELLFSFINAYKMTILPFKDERAYQIDDGFIIWDKKRWISFKKIS